MKHVTPEVRHAVYKTLPKDHVSEHLVHIFVFQQTLYLELLFKHFLSLLVKLNYFLLPQILIQKLLCLTRLNFLKSEGLLNLSDITALSHLFGIAFDSQRLPSLVHFLLMLQLLLIHYTIFLVLGFVLFFLFLSKSLRNHALGSYLVNVFDECCHVETVLKELGTQYSN